MMSYIIITFCNVRPCGSVILPIIGNKIRIENFLYEVGEIFSFCPVTLKSVKIW